MRLLRALAEFVVLFGGLLLYSGSGVPRALGQGWRRR